MLNLLVDYWRQYPSPLAVLVPVFILVNIWVAFAYLLAKKIKLLPKIRGRDVHTTAKPRVGGVAMWLTVLLALITITSSPGWRDLLHFTSHNIYGIDSALWGIFSGMLVIFIFGLWDDIFGLSPLKQLLGQVLAAFCLIVFGVGVTFIHLPGGGSLALDALAIHLPALLGGGTLLVWSALFTLAWVVIMINVMNFFDGLDGLAGSIAMTAAVVLFFVSQRVGFTATATLSLIVAATTAGFLIWNWHPAKLFMGTIGSQLLGFLLAVIAIISGGKVATAVLVLGIPILDALVVVGRRLIAKQSPFKADQRHLHHRLLKIGLPVPWVVILLNAAGVTLGIVAIPIQESSTKGWLMILLLIIMAIFIALTYALEQRVEKRVELKHGQ